MSRPATTVPLDAPGLAVATLCCALWGGNGVAVKYAVGGGHLPPLGSAGLRFLIALPVIAMACGKMGATLRVDRRLWWLVILHGVLAALQIGAFNWGTSLSEAGRSAVFVNVHPFLVAPMAWILLGESLGPRRIAGLIAAAAGVAVLLAKPLMLGGGGLVGDLVVLASGVIFAFQTIAQKKTFPLIPPTTLLLLQTAIAGPLTLGLSLAIEGPARFHLTWEAMGGLAYQGLGVSGVCFTLWMILLRRYPAVQLSAITFMVPAFGILIANLTLGEPFTWPLAIGGSLVALGIYLVSSDDE
ncbi:DMT family transporter [Tundrisphaera sp. TA3]|uniref:DMT family transporter n=1 Tax=Tundrisphaera sp. TA3 TaxID=3435775 RepID=UPI003EBBEC28